MHLLRQHIARLRWQTRWLLMLSALGWMLAECLAIVIALVSINYVLRIDDPGLRLASTISAICAIAWMVVRYLLPAMRVPLDDIRLARRVEQRYPELTDRLASALDFLNQSEDDAQTGSSELRRAVIAEATAEVENLNWSAVLNRRPTLVALGFGGLVLVLAAVLISLRPSEARIGLTHLVLPWSDVEWPREHRLALRLEVTRIATGQDFEVEVVDLNGELPDDLRMIYRDLSDAEPLGEEQQVLRAMRGAAIARKEAVTRPFEYRAVGGDDQSMPWTAVEVLEPPRVEAVEVTLHPPAYTGRLPEQSERRIEALRGSAVELEGRATKRIVSAIVRQENGPSIPLAISKDGSGFRLTGKGPVAPLPQVPHHDADESQEWIVDRSGNYWIELTDVDGLVGGRDDSWELKALPDAPPQVAIERPVGTLYVTPRAAARLRIVARDDLALREVAVHYLRSDQSDQGEQRTVVFAGPASLVTGERPSDEAADLTSRTIAYDWELESLGLRPGTQITATAAASDYLPQSTHSQPIRLVVLSAAEFEEHIASRQAALLAEVARILRVQHQTRAQTEELALQAARVGTFRQRDIDGLHSAELKQRQLRRSLANPTEGVLPQAQSLIDELHANRIDNTESHRRIAQIHAEIRRLDAEELASIEDHFLRVTKSQHPMSEPADDADSLTRLVEPLESAVAAQAKVIRSLEGLLERLQEWTSFRSISRDLVQIHNDQTALASRARATRSTTLGKQPEDLSAQQASDLASMSNSQGELARRFDNLSQRMEQAQSVLQQSTPLVADSLAAAIQLAREQQIASQMRDAERHVKGNQLGRAIDDQTKINETLTELIDTLSGRREHELARLVKKLRDAERGLEGLRSRQEELLKAAQKANELAKADSSGNHQHTVREQLQRLIRQQRQLRQELDRNARELERLRAERAADKVAAAGDYLDRASQAAEQGDAAKTADLADEAKRDLDEAQRELAQQRRQAEHDLANEQLASIRDLLAGLVARQESVIQETRRLNGSRDREGRLNAEQAQSVAQLAREQQTLHAEAVDLAEKVASASVFQLALQSAAEQMARAAGLLVDQKTDVETQSAAQHALDRLKQLQSALENQEKSSGDNQPTNGGSAGDQQPLAPDQPVPSMAELELLKVMQEDVYRQTVELRQKLAGRPPNPVEAGKLRDLGKEQGRIAALVATLSARAAAQATEATDSERTDRNHVNDPSPRQSEQFDQADENSKNASESPKRD